MQEIERYKERLDSFKLANRTKELYLYYYVKLHSALQDTPINEQYATAFIIRYPNSVAMAFIHDYLSWKNLNIKLEKRLIDRKPKRLKRALSKQDIEILGNYILEKYGLKYFIMLNLAYEGGLRLQETIGFNYASLREDFSQWDKTQPLRLTLRKETTKGNKQRNIVISNGLSLLFREYISLNIDKILETTHPNNVFMCKKSRWDKIFTDSCMAVLHRKHHLHELRFSRATSWYVDYKLDILTIKNLLGHESISTTQIYIDKSQEQALRQLEKLYKEN